MPEKRQQKQPANGQSSLESAPGLALTEKGLVGSCDNGHTAGVRKRARIKRDSSSGYSAVANQYARDVAAGKILACKWVRLACERHLKDLAREREKDYPYRFDRKKAEYVCRFIEQLPHTKGRWARPAIGETNRLKMEPWQIFKTACIFGWVEKATGFRRFRRVYDCEPRKQGKSPWAAAVGLYMFCADGEYGAEVYSGANTEKQAWEVFRPARLMAIKTPELQQYFGVQVNAKGLLVEDDFSRFEPLIGKPGDGGAPSCAIIDEFHEAIDTDLRDTMYTGMAGREQPLELIITTAGSTIEGPCHTVQQEGQKVLEGFIEDDRFFVIIYTIDDGDDWRSEEALRKANPNFDVSVSGTYLRTAVRESLQSAHKQAIVKTKHLNIWVNARTGWMNLEAWKRCEDKSLNIEDFLGQEVYEGVDLSAVIDLASRCRLFTRFIEGKRHYFAFWRHYAPQDRVQDGEHQHYAKWADDGYLIAIPGPEIQLGQIQREIEDDLKRFRYRAIAFDPWSALQMQQELAARFGQDKPASADGIGREIVITIPQQTRYLSPAMQEVEAAVLAGRFHHSGDPLASWAISNVVVKPDGNDQIFPRKEAHGRNKIDPASALFNAISRAMVSKPKRQSFTPFVI
jgi:phage terminase large subunit-like protein